MKLTSNPLYKRLKRVNPWVYVFLLPTIIVFVMFYLWPIIEILYTSFTQWRGGSRPPVFIGFDNFTRLFQSPSFRAALVNLFWWTVIAIVLHVGFGTLAALILFRKPFGWRFTRSVFMIPNVISVAAWAMIFRSMFDNDRGFINDIVRIFNPSFNVNWLASIPYSFWLVTFTWLLFAVVVTLIVQGDLMAIPSELREAARTDGASDLQIVWRIDLPLCRGAIGTGVILSVTSRISMYESIVLTTGGGPGTSTLNLPILMFNQVRDSHFGYANAMSMIMILIGFMTLLIVSKVFRTNESYY